MADAHPGQKLAQFSGCCTAVLVARTLAPLTFCCSPRPQRIPERGLQNSSCEVAAERRQVCSNTVERRASRVAVTGSPDVSVTATRLCWLKGMPPTNLSPLRGYSATWVTKSALLATNLRTALSNSGCDLAAKWRHYFTKVPPLRSYSANWSKQDYAIDCVSKGRRVRVGSGRNQDDFCRNGEISGLPDDVVGANLLVLGFEPQ